MLGPAKPRHLDQPIAVSAEDLVPADNFYRHLEAKLDLGRGLISSGGLLDATGTTPPHPAASRHRVAVGNGRGVGAVATMDPSAGP
jgi:hypothetical protein